MTETHNWLDGLNDRQREAVLYFDSPLLVLAGAGSGKTRVLTYKIAYIVNELRKSPYNIFAVTFTNKAANEMKERVEHLINRDMKGMWIGTFHSMCVRMIRMYRRQKGEDSSFTIYDADDALSIIKRIMKDKNISERTEPRTVCKTISALKSKMVSPEEYLSYTESPIQRDIATVYAEYERMLKKNNGLDFDSILVESVKILKTDEPFKEQMRGIFKYILVDEYQDTNYVQYVLLRELCSPEASITVVGDDDQSIYGFRGAEIGNILNFEKDFQGTKIVKLEQNYRSTMNILDCASDMIANNRKRKEKRLWSDAERGMPVIVRGFNDERGEAEYVFENIALGLASRNAKLSNTAVLYRTNAQSRAFEEVFRKHNLPYTVIGGMKFFERKEIKDILAYLNILVNPSDEYSFRRIYNVPRRGIGEKSYQAIVEVARENGISTYSLITECENYIRNIPPTCHRGVRALSKLFKEMQEFLPNAYDAVMNVIKMTGYNEMLDALDELEKISRKENVQELANSAFEFCEGADDPHLKYYLDMISLYTDIDAYKDENDLLPIMTVHNAKGLEFDTVFITGVEEGIFPHRNSFMSETGIEEERRLMYVAMTRARMNLHISYARSRHTFGSYVASGVSRFIGELPQEHIDEMRTSLRMQEPAPAPLRDAGSKAEKKRDIDKLTINDKINHPTLGKGTVKGLKGSGDDLIAIIQFRNGDTKKIYVKYANMKKE